ncbi:MAG TPA: rod shape-determining protein RodA [Candidatus Avisuccinivibrio pullicola]|nr:rod shape-determining protein RodA [Candidatus Avisuccinivibrio pullicola]
MTENSARTLHDDGPVAARGSWLTRRHIDLPLILGLLMTLLLSLFVLYSASGQHPEMLWRQIVRTSLAFSVMIVVAQFSPRFYARASIYLYIGCIALLIMVELFGDISKGAQRWLNLGFMRIQPSELLKVVMPLTIAAFLSRDNLPPRTGNIVIAFILILVPVGLILKQPDLGTAALVGVSGFIAVFLAGLSFWWLAAGAIAGAAAIPVMWNYVLHDYQKQRVLTLIDPESDPLGAGYHIIQSKIAIGSGGLYGKGWLQGSQSQLDFLPEPHTDFIFAVLAEETGLIGFLILLSVYIYLITRCTLISFGARSNFERILSATYTFTFVFYIFVNIGMVSGILPVVGVPLPMISYGGTSMITLAISFGIIMSVHTHKRNFTFR